MIYILFICFQNAVNLQMKHIKLIFWYAINDLERKKHGKEEINYPYL